MSALEIRAAADGAPEAFWADVSESVSISISHSRDRSLCVVGPRDFTVGCDLEWIETREENLIGDHFTPEEITLATQMPALEKNLAVNLIWSAKESALKILRAGMRRDTRSVCIRPDFGERRSSWNIWTGKCLISSRVFSGWWCSRDRYVDTLASDPFTARPREW